MWAALYFEEKKSLTLSFSLPLATLRNAAAKKKLAEASVSPLSRRMRGSPLAPRSPNVNENRSNKEIKMGRSASMSPSGRGSVFARQEEVVYVDEEVAFRKPSRHDAMPGHNLPPAMPQSRFGSSASLSPQSRRSISPHPSMSPYQVNEAAYSARMRSPSPHATMARQSASPISSGQVATFVADVIQQELETEKLVIMEETAKVRADIVSVRQQVLARREQRDMHSPSQQWFESLSVLQRNRENNVLSLEAPAISLRGRSQSRSRSRSPSPANGEFKVGPTRQGDRSPSPMVSQPKTPFSKCLFFAGGH